MARPCSFLFLVLSNNRAPSTTRRWPYRDWIRWRPIASKCLPTTASRIKCRWPSTSTSTLPSPQRRRCHRLSPTFASATSDRQRWPCAGTLRTILIRTLRCTKSATSWRDSRTMPRAFSSTDPSRRSVTCASRQFTASKSGPKPLTAGASSACPSTKRLEQSSVRIAWNNLHGTRF